MNPITDYFIGFDLGKDRDHSAIAVMAFSRIDDGPFDRVYFRQPTRPVLDLVMLNRIPLGTPYLDIVKRLRATVTRLLTSQSWGQRSPRVHVVVDSAGPGQVMLELIRAERLEILLVPVVLTGGAEPGRTPTGKHSVPRRELVSNARLLLECEVIRIAGGLTFGPALEREFAAIRPDGGQSQHDDLAISAGLAAWRASRIYPEIFALRAVFR